MATHEKSEARIGWWKTTCCHEDLERIDSQEDLEWAINDPSETVWPTEKEALEDMLPDYDCLMREQILKRLTEIG